MCRELVCLEFGFVGWQSRMDLVRTVVWALFVCLLVVVLGGSLDGHRLVEAGECGGKGPMGAAMRLLPCLRASQDAHAPVSPACCTAVQEIIRDPQCFCAMVSLGWSQQGLNPAIALSVPRRCGIPNSPTCSVVRLP